jgi:hypothetical protein
MHDAALLAALVAAEILAAATPPPVITPKFFERGTSEFVFPSTLEIKVTAVAKEKLKILEEMLVGTDVSLRIAPVKDADVETVLVGEADWRARKAEVPPTAEGFLLEVTSRSVLLMARESMGIQWGLLKLKELLDPKRKSVPAVLVRDWPDLPWRGVHIFMPAENEFETFRKFVDQVLLPYRFNTIVLEVNYNFSFQSKPEIAEAESRGAAFCKDVASYCADRGFRVIPEFNCFGHQSWEKQTAALLRAHPELDETPQLVANDPRLYCRSWCPRHPILAPILMDLWTELIAAFGSSFFHIGMDEVFFIAEKECPRCRGSTPWEVFLAAATQYHAFFRGARNEVLMWGDRLLPASRFGYSKFEGSETDTWKALACLPRDIILCDWHYGVRKDYPSIKYFLDEGFRVLACPWRDPKNVESLWQYARSVRTDRFLGFLATTWVSFKDLSGALFRDEGSENAKGAAACLKLVGTLCWQGSAAEGR